MSIVDLRMSVRSYTKRKGTVDAFKEFVYHFTTMPVVFDPTALVLEGDYTVLLFTFAQDSIDALRDVLTSFKPQGMRPTKAQFLIADDLRKNKKKKGFHVVETHTPHFTFHVYHGDCNEVTGRWHNWRIWHDLFSESLPQLTDKLNILNRPDNLTSFNLVCGFSHTHNFLFTDAFIDALKIWVNKKPSVIGGPKREKQPW